MDSVTQPQFEQLGPGVYCRTKTDFVLKGHYIFFLYINRLLAWSYYFLFQRRSEVIATYALCGFTNFLGLGVLLGGLGPIAPSRQGDMARIALRTLLAATIACFMTASIAGKCCVVMATEYCKASGEKIQYNE